MSYYPVFLDLNGKKVIVVGGGKVAERKIANLQDYGCHIYIFSQRLTPFLSQLVSEKKIHPLAPEQLDSSIKDAFMVITATDDPELNSEIASKAKESGSLVNAVDRPDDCNFIVPSIIKRGDLQIAISTAGKSPAMAKKIRKDLDLLFGPEYGSLLKLLGHIRIRLLAEGYPSSKNKIFFQQLVDSELLELIRLEDQDGIKATIKSILGDDFPVEETIKQIFRG